MIYKKFSPTGLLSPFVECYFAWEGRADGTTVVQSPPNGFCAVVVNTADQYSASQGNGPLHPVPTAFVSGQFTSNYQLHLSGTIAMVGIVLKPASLHNFFGIRMSELVNSRAPLSFLPGIDEQRLVGEIGRQPSLPDRINLLETFVLPFVAKGKSNLSLIDEAIDHIDSLKGCITVEKLSAHFKVSRRYLEKKFLEKVGVSPKFYGRIKRFGSLSNIIAHNEQVDWQQIVLQYGFHDQSHLVKEFIEFNQMNPTQYHSLHREMTRFIK